MAWVRSEYAAELAVLSAWVSALLPLNVAWHGSAPPANSSVVVFLRFALFELQYRIPATVTVTDADTGAVTEVGAERVAGILAAVYPGTELAFDFFLTTPPTAAAFYRGSDPALATASLAGTVAALAVLAAVGLGVALYLRAGAVRARLPVTEPRAVGALLAVAAGAGAVATWYYYLGRATAGLPIPVGVVLVGALAAVLLRTERA
jgi:hypothetical protein